MDCTHDEQTRLLETLAYKVEVRTNDGKRPLVFPNDPGLHRRRLLHDENWFTKPWLSGASCCMAEDAGMSASGRSGSCKIAETDKPQH